MHPAAIKYGLANNLIQFQGADVLLSDPFLEHMAAMAKDELGGKRIDGSTLLDEVIDNSLAEMDIEYEGVRGERNAFYANVNVLLFDTMFPYAERAGIGYRVERTFYFTRQFGSELNERKALLRPIAEEDRNYTKVLFLACYDAVVARCERAIPEYSRHFDLLALCMFQAYDSIIMNNFMERFGTP